MMPMRFSAIERLQSGLNRDVTFATLVSALFMLLSGIGLLHHEMWRDELQAWLLARDSHSIVELLQHLRYETGHQFLWHLCLYGIGHFTANPQFMQLLHLLIAAASVYLLNRYSPFKRWQKLCLSFGYFFFYEYSIISRNYGLGLFFIIVFCVLFQNRQKQYLLLASVLFLMANTNFYSLLCAISLGLTLIFECLLDRNKRLNLGLSAYFSLGIWLVGFILGLLQAIAPADSGLLAPEPAKPLLEKLVTTLAILWKSYAPMPGFSLQFWNTNILDDGIAAVLSCLIIGFSIAIFIRKPIALFLYLTGTCEIVLVNFLKHGGGMRHWGYLFALLIANLWICRYVPDTQISWQKWLTSNRIVRFFTRYQNQFLQFIFSVQLVAGLFAYGMDVLHPFSQAQATAAWIQTYTVSQAVSIAGDRDWAMIPISGFLEAPIYHLASDRVGTFVVWNNQRQELPSESILQKATQFASQQNQSVLLVLNYPMSNLAELARFTGAIVKNENYYLYRIQ